MKLRPKTYTYPVYEVDWYGYMTKASDIVYTESVIPDQAQIEMTPISQVDEAD